MANNVWIDDAYAYSGLTLNYCIKMNGQKIYEGIATAQDFPIRIFLNRIAQKYLQSTFPTNTGVTADSGASAVFSLVRLSGNTEAEVLYTQTYIDAYDGVFDGNMAEPINCHADPRQRIFYTSYNSGSTTIEI